MNALEFVVIPKIETTIAWIESELDELDREEFYRLKCVQDKKKEAKEEEDLEIEARNAKLKKLMGDQKVNDDDKNDFFDEKNILEDEDEDVIF